MNVSFDGLRRNATNSMNRLHDAINELCSDKRIEYIDKDLIDSLREKFNQAAMFVDTFNCLYDDSVEGDMNNLSDLSISRLEDLEKNEEDE